MNMKFNNKRAISELFGVSEEDSFKIMANFCAHAAFKITSKEHCDDSSLISYIQETYKDQQNVKEMVLLLFGKLSVEYDSDKKGLMASAVALKNLASPDNEEQLAKMLMKRIEKQRNTIVES